MSIVLGCDFCTTSTLVLDELAVAKVAHLPFPVPSLHALPTRPSRHTQLIETQLFTTRYVPRPDSYPSWSQPSRSPVPPLCPNLAGRLHVSILFASFI